MSYTDREYVVEQYRTPKNLNARIALHERFSTNRYGWMRWVFDQFELQSEARLLEIGCGPGGLWAENLGRIPERWRITLTDASPGMVSQAQRNLAGDRRFNFQTADAQDLSFDDTSFDAVIANHMLYHVPDRPKALAEIARVLKEGGTLYAATGGRESMREMGGMLRVLDPTHPADFPSKVLLAFNLENGTEQLAPYFSEVTIRHYEDSLAVTEAQPLVNWLLSTITARNAEEQLPEKEWRGRVEQLAASVERELAARGVIHISKDSGMFVARR
jgi:ubiquinone/menaquinone biosynthesis C-methylase UbiE